MATHTYTRSSEGGTIGAGTDKTYTTAAFTVPAGEKFKRLKVRDPNGTTTNIQLRGDARTVFGGSGMWDTWKSSVSSIWTDGKGCKIQCHNSGNSGYSMRIYVDFETEDLPYTAVKAGDKIKATDRSQTGTATTAGTVIQDSHFSAGTSAKASTFNDKVLGM